MRLARAQRALDAYLEANRYPPTSRPIAEQPDLRDPHHVATTGGPLARSDHKVTDAHVALDQDRLFLVGTDVVTFTMRCANSDGPAPCEIDSARAEAPPSEAARPGASPPPAVPVAFTTDATGVATATFQPSAQGFAGYDGGIRVTAEVRVRSETGEASYELRYTSSAPARFTGNVRDALDKGSVGFFVGMDVAKAGRYVLAARVDDASGKTFAYLSFNDELAAGKQDVELTLFGKLVRDAHARSPFRLRDLEGFLLLEDRHPDRETMAGIDGIVHTSRAYAPNELSDAAWASDEKSRYVNELTKDVDEAKRNAASQR